METKDLLYGIGLLLTAAVAISSLIATLRAGRHTRFINTVTSERVKWLEQLRQDISTFAGLTYNWSHASSINQRDEAELLEQVDKLRFLVRLRLNPKGEHDKKIEKLLSEIPQYTDSHRRKELIAALEEFTVTTQSLLKEEWDKVKLEAEYGNLRNKPLSKKTALSWAAVITSAVFLVGAW